MRSPRPKALPRWPASAALSNSTASSSIRVGCRALGIHVSTDPRRRRGQQHGHRRTYGRTLRNRIRGAWTRTTSRILTISRRSFSKAKDGVPVLVERRGAGRVAPDERRGITELDGEGEVVGGVASSGLAQNALSVIDNVKERLSMNRQDKFARGTEIETVYDRSDLIHRPSKR